MPTYPGWAELDANNGEPQIGQNSLIAILPLSATFSNRRVCPVTMFNAVLFTITVGE
jgi:hypothetical protein